MTDPAAPAGPARRLRPLLRSPRLLALAAGALSALAFAPVHAVLVLWLSFPALALLLRRSGPRGAFATGWAFGLGHFAAGLYWIGASFGPAGHGGWWAGAPAVAGTAAGLALFPALAAWASRLAPEGLPRLLALAAAWPLAEALRSHVLSGFPWNLLGHAWAFSAETLQPVAWIGVHGLGALTALAALAPAALAVRGRAACGLLLLPLAAALALGALRGEAPAAPADAPVIRIVQGNVAQEVKSDPARFGEGVVAHMEASAVPPRGRAPALVVWSETAVPLDPADDASLRRKLLASVPGGAWLATGAFRIGKGDEAGRVYNSLYLLDPGGAVAAVYDKARLVPFGEFLPLAESFPALARPLGGRGLSAGPAPSPVELPGLPPFLPLICYEVAFPADTGPGRRPGWMLNVSNDAWFGRSSGPWQHLALARARAVEEGVPVVRGTNTGVSAVIGPRGRMPFRLGLGERGVIDAPLPPADPPTLHARMGDAPLFVLLALALGALAARGAAGRRGGARRGGGPEA